ncbi:SLAC1 family transporter [Vibrio metschnikovii]
MSSSLAGTQFGHTVFLKRWLVSAVAIYFVMLPVVLYRLVFEGMLPRRARPTLAIMAAPINLTLATYLVNFATPDPILTGALAEYCHHHDAINLSLLFQAIAFSLSTFSCCAYFSFGDQRYRDASFNRLFFRILPTLVLATSVWFI